MSQELFADSFGNIAVTGTLVRIDLVSLSGQDKDGKPVFEKTHRVVMPLDGFLRSFSMSEDVIQRLIKAGLVQRKGDTAEATPAAAATPAAPVSPNFS